MNISIYKKVCAGIRIVKRPFGYVLKIGRRTKLRSFCLKTIINFKHSIIKRRLELLGY